MTIVLGSVDLLLYLAVAAILVRKYRHGKEAGFLWLAVPLALIPAISLPVSLWRHAAADRLIAGKEIGIFPFTLVEQGRFTIGALLTLLNFADHAVWGVFALAAVLVLVRRKE